MNLQELTERYENVSFNKGKFISDKSHKFDCVYFVGQCIFNYTFNGIFNVDETKDILESYISRVFNIEINDSLRNYYKETISLLLFASVLEVKDKGKYYLSDPEVLGFISEREENAYIFIYVLCYFIMINCNCMDDYRLFCYQKDFNDKTKILKNIHIKLADENPSVGNMDSQWAKASTKYIIENLNYINNQPHVTRTLGMKECIGPERINMIALNIEGTRTVKEKNNDYLKTFDVLYIKNMLKDILVMEEE